ncbi:uncharacterized protein [Choristoneura fumiferana]|uniref:uncharacterized protein n=1 Tax=Choristoneura fumiferana TaxID=7141 RepID=UPI003D15D62A
MNEVFEADSKYTCRCCLRTSDNVSTMTPEEISLLKNYVKVDSTNTIVKICYICSYMFRKFEKFIVQCQKSNDVMNNLLEEDHIFHLSKCKPHHNFVSTLPQIHYLGPTMEITQNYDYDELKHENDEVDKFCDDVQCDDGDRRDDDDIPLVMLKAVKEEIDVKVRKRKKKEGKRFSNQVTQDCESKSRSKVKRQLKEGFSSRMVQETTEYEVIKLTKEQVLQEMEENCKSDKYQRSVYKCQMCAKGFNFKDVIDSHMKKHSLEHGTLRCDICTQYCPSAVSLRGHMKSHTTRYKCKICGAVRISRQHLLEHYSIEHTSDAAVYTCDQCPFTSRTRTVMQRHVKTHTTGKTLTCSVCGAGFSTMHTLRMHASRHDPSQRYNCPQCNMKFIYPSLLHRHMRVHSHRDHYCVECDITFKSIDNLKLHFKRAKRHRDPSTYKYKCSQCSDRFVSPSSVLAHLTAAHGAAKTHACSLCGKLYSSRESVKSHERRAHAKEATVSCDVCHKEFSRKYVLAKHLRSHDVSEGCCGVYDQSAKQEKQEETISEIQANHET